MKVLTTNGVYIELNDSLEGSRCILPADENNPTEYGHIVGVEGNSLVVEIDPEFRQREMGKEFDTSPLDTTNGDDDGLREVSPDQVIIDMSGSSNKKIPESFGAAAAGFQAPLGVEDQVRALVKGRVKEIVRKKKDGGYVLYAPNRGKKGKPKKIGEFPTKAAAKQAELNRFPPRDPEKLARAKAAVDSMRRRKRKSESLSRIHEDLVGAASDALDDVDDTDTDAPLGIEPGERDAPDPTPTEKQLPKREDESRWEQLLSSVSQEAVRRDSRLKSLTQRIENQSVRALERTVKILSREISYKVSKGKNGTDKMGRPYITCVIQTDTGKVGPVYFYVRGDMLHVVSDGSVKSDIMKLDPEAAKEVRAALTSLPDSFDNKRIREAIEQRDEYLASIEKQADRYLSDLDGLEMTILKKLLADKYMGEDKP